MEKGLTREKIDAIQDRIREVYLGDSRPWVIGYSGGKDSSCALQLIWYSLQKLSEKQRQKTIYVICSDTLVETPAVVNQLSKSLDQIQAAADNEKLPIKVEKVVPETKDTFWVNMIGRGIPAPYTNFRWCTDRMKIAPTTKFIKEKIADFGEVMIILGSRKTESASRGQVMSNRRDKGAYLSWHNDIANALVFTPIEDWETNDVWEYLMAVPSPWAGRNDAIVTMYRNAQAGECPLVIDKSTPSCGGGRFGCWTCTVVDRDRSMEAMIDNGEDWMQPLLDLRDWLRDTQIPENKPKIRDHRRRNGKVQYFDANDEKRIVWGPYKMEFRREILTKLLQAQKQVREDGPDSDLELITKKELHKIRQLWIHDEGDWEDCLPDLYEKETGESLEWLRDDHAGVGGLEKELLSEVASENNLPEKLLQELIDLELQHSGMSRRSGIYGQIEKIFGKDWQTREEALAPTENQPGIEK